MWFCKLTCSCWMSPVLFTGLSLLRPMYYEYPESSEAYTFDHQVCFPPQVVENKETHLVFFVHLLHTHTVFLWCRHSGSSCDSTDGQYYSNGGKGDLDTRGSMTMKRIAYMCLSIFLCPPFSTPIQGTFISWFSGEMISGPQNITRNFSLSEIPVYVRAGAIIPMRTDDFCRFTCWPFVSLVKLLTLFSFFILAPLGSAQEIPSKLKFVVFVGDATS